MCHCAENIITKDVSARANNLLLWLKKRTAYAVLLMVFAVAAEIVSR